MIRETWQKLLFWAEKLPISEDRIETCLLHRDVPLGSLREFESAGQPSRLLAALGILSHRTILARGRAVVCDLIEAARPKVDDYVLKFLEQHAFKKNDFFE